MKYLSIIILTLTITVAHGQTAKVIELSPADAAKAKQLYDQLQAAQKAVDTFHAEIYQRYVVVAAQKASSTGVITVYDTRDGFEGDFQYSEDFRFIVPLPFTRRDTFTIGQPYGCSYTVSPNMWTGSTQ